MKRRSGEGPPRGPQTVVRAMSVLKAFDEAHREWGVTDLAQRLEMSKSTVFRLLAALVDTGMVVQDPESERYRLGPEAITLGARALRGSDLRTASRGALEELAQASGETATLEVLMGDEILILDEVAGGHLVGSAASVGTRWPAHATSTGKLLLAHGERDAVAPRDGAALTAYTRHTVTDWEALKEELARIRRHGYATAVEELELGYAAVAAPVRDHRGRVVAALSLGGPTARLHGGRLTELGALLCRAADRVSAQLGWVPTETAEPETAAPSARASKSRR